MRSFAHRLWNQHFQPINHLVAVCSLVETSKLYEIVFLRILNDVQLSFIDIIILKKKNLIVNYYENCALHFRYIQKIPSTVTSITFNCIVINLVLHTWDFVIERFWLRFSDAIDVIRLIFQLKFTYRHSVLHFSTKSCIRSISTQLRHTYIRRKIKSSSGSKEIEIKIACTLTAWKSNFQHSVRFTETDFRCACKWIPSFRSPSDAGRLAVLCRWWFIFEIQIFAKPRFVRRFSFRQRNCAKSRSHIQ